jgi:thiamine-phosphate pyrophosphorylase
VFATASKERPDPVVGLSLVAGARLRTAKKLVAIGGIHAGNVAEVLAAGADAAAVLGAVCRGDIGANCRRLLAAAAQDRCASS